MVNSDVTSMDVSNLSNLKSLRLDANLGLRSIAIRNDPRSAIDLTQVPLLESLNRIKNQFTEVGLMLLATLTNVVVSNNQLVVLEVSTN
jgi:Leucine-rich repeat (LRR) protein